MRYIIYTILILLASCKSSPSDDKLKQVDSDTLINSDKEKIDNSEVAQELSVEDFLDSMLIVKLIKLDTDTLDISHYEELLKSDSLIEISDSLFLSFYDLSELKPFNDYYGFLHYYFAYGDIIANKYLPLIVLNSDWETSQALDVFLIDTNKNATGFFQASSLELQPTYGISTCGFFESKTNFSQEYTDYEINGDKMYKKTVVFKYDITSDGKINRREISISKDTLDYKPDYQ